MAGAVIAVPEEWCAESGCARREALFAELSAVPVPVPRFVPAAVAVLAGSAGPAPVDGPVERLVCDIGPERVGVTLCRVSGAPGAPGAVVEHADSATAGPAGVPREGGPAAHALAHRRAGGDLARRAELLLARALVLPRYRDAPLHPADGPPTSPAVTAGQAIDAFTPVADALRAAGAALSARCSPRAGAPDRVVVTGALAAHPLARHAVDRCLPAMWGAPRVDVPAPGAAAAGALLIAEGAVRALEPAPHTLGLPAHEIRRGRLVARRIPLTEAGSPAPLTVTADGVPVVVEIPRAEEFRLRVEVQEYGRGARRALAPPCAAPPAGKYHVGLHPVRHGFGVLVLRPAGGGEAALVPLGAPAGG
ncbi:hypothetical protein M1P56_13920 [Streptomyces sp. HU2014]|uniref:hypothetical protein n=1 Tax=Streptomyces sp. HU2014 TaxID=2939414 RepID=UPI00200D0889|nr:hypothetical protein [Streptomyces sp. HU2014]UQI45367.1 hypothetical protein M1P56_13920 [Streptomyces sp. HU2014]